MHLVLCCATRRGLRFLQRLGELAPEAELTVFCFREAPSEPLFFRDIELEAERRNARFIEARSLGHSRLADFWETTRFDLLLAVSWRYLIPKRVYSRARVDLSMATAHQIRDLIARETGLDVGKLH